MKNRLHATQTTLRGPGTFNHKPLVLVAEADLWSGIPLTALGIDGRVPAGVGIAAAFERIRRKGRKHIRQRIREQMRK